MREKTMSPRDRVLGLGIVCWCRFIIANRRKLPNQRGCLKKSLLHCSW